MKVNYPFKYPPRNVSPYWCQSF